MNIIDEWRIDSIRRERRRVRLFFVGYFALYLAFIVGVTAWFMST